MCRVNSSSKSQSHSVSDLHTQNLHAGKRTGLKQEINIRITVLHFLKWLFPSWQQVLSLNTKHSLLNQFLSALLSQFLTESKDLIWSHMLTNSRPYNEELVFHAFHHISLLKFAYLKMISENTTTSPHPSVRSGSRRKQIWTFWAAFLTPQGAQSWVERQANRGEFYYGVPRRPVFPQAHNKCTPSAFPTSWPDYKKYCMISKHKVDTSSLNV